MLQNCDCKGVPRYSLVSYKTLAAFLWRFAASARYRHSRRLRGIEAFRWSSLLGLRQVALPQRPPKHCPQSLFTAQTSAAAVDNKTR